MRYIDFYNHWHKFGCVNIYQIYAWRRDFNRVNLYHWIKKGYIVKLRKEWYAFAESLRWPDFGEYVANRIYRPSYLSLHYALAHYGMIPEGVFQYTSVTSLKTAEFTNPFGNYSYQSVKRELMFGYKPLLMKDGRAIYFATPEKALMDLLYLYPFYKTEQDMLDLRLDEDFMEEDFDYELFLKYASAVKSKEFHNRINILIATYRP